MILTDGEILETLKSVIDPEIGLNIVDLGLIYSLDIKEHSVTVTMTLTTPGCPMHDSMTKWVQESISQLDPEVKANINLVWSPSWTPDKMSESAKRQLGF